MRDRARHPVDGHEPPATEESSGEQESDADFGSRMQAAESEAERFGDPDAEEIAPARTTGRGAPPEDGAAEAALRSYTDSQPAPPVTEPLTDPFGELGHAYN